MADKQSREECVGGTTIQEQYAEILKRKKAGELTVKIDVDVSEALVGLKAIQREARDAVKALRELEAAKNGEANPIIKSQTYVDVNEIKIDTVSDDIRRSYE